MFNTHDNTGIVLVFKKLSKQSKSWVRDALSVSYIKSKPQLVKKARFTFKFSYFG